MKKVNFCRSKIAALKHKRILKKVRMGNEHLRLRFVKSNLHIYIQVINDKERHTILSSSSLQLKLKNGNMENSKLVAKDLIKKIQDKKIERLALDRGPYKYHGKIALVADLLREEGIKI